MKGTQRALTVLKKPRYSDSPKRASSSASGLLARSASTDISITREASSSSSTVYEMTIIEKRPEVVGNSGNSMKIISSNIISLRTLIEKQKAKLISFVNREKPDVFCMQEVKLSTHHIPQFRALFPGFRDFWCLSNDKKGYSGVGVFVRDGTSNLIGDKLHKQPTINQFFTSSSSKRKIDDDDETKDGDEMTLLPNPKPIRYSVISHSTGIGIPKHDQEGRVITIEFDSYYLVNSYVPNSGADLNRLDYRVDEWDADFSNYIKTLQTKKPVVLAGDLNVAHLNNDIYDLRARHIPTQSGCTTRERNSFSEKFFGGNCNLRDSFRVIHPNARNIFSYWSVRSSAYQPNRGLRLDYFLASPELLPGSLGYVAPHFPDTSTTTSSSSSYPAFEDLPVPAIHESLVLRDDCFYNGDHCPISIIVKIA